jgi:simple sugar transport system permease protein
MRPGSQRTQSRIVALGLAIVLAAAYALFASAEPVQALRATFLGPFSSAYALLAMLESTAPLLVCALGACIAFRAGAFNLGGEGQASVGTLASALAISVLERAEGLPPGLVIAMALLAAALAGAALAMLSSLAERYTGAEVMLTSFLLAQAALIAVDWAIGGPLRDAGSNLLGMPIVPDRLRFPKLAPPSPLSAAFPISVALALGTIFLTKGTRAGVELRLLGKNPEFARAVGLSPRLGVWAMAGSGALAAIGGSFLVLGQAGRAVRGMTGGIGWSGLAVALIAGSDGVGAMPVALFFAWLDSGARQAAVLADLSPDSSSILKAAALFLITAKVTGSCPFKAASERKGGAQVDSAPRPR